ncbi:hypothetical protein C5167_043170 [Papaver somniferum]|uniref:Uncharacterized protein n=1 Tax=Papaver somniferum TaxID=3469 RepID=A0A4Y7L817_PAPSO|nr:uncharacterized protein LOC113316836 isoform X1 [Papaver somniferum]RZC80598.1 hypothetical protein C5167_043170 [Papaver somniferum]
MPLLQSSPTPHLYLPFFKKHLSYYHPKHFTIVSTRHQSKFPRTTISFSQNPKSLPTEIEILESIAEFNGEKETKNLPGVRTYENDLARLTLIGDVSFEQALTAASADGGEAANQHILSGLSTMVVETIFPGSSDEHSTIATRLFLPSRKVKEKARKLRNTLPPEMLSGSTSKNILAMTFRQVVCQSIWSFQLAMFSPGTKRNMDDLENQREIPTLFTITSSGGDCVLSLLAEVVCAAVLESTEKDFHQNAHGTTSRNIYPWFQKSRRIASKDSSILLYEIHQDEILENAKAYLKNFEGRKDCGSRNMKGKHWWTPSTYSKLEKIGGTEFSNWASEYIPAYRLQIDTDKLKDVKLDGWRKSEENRWEVLLTHSQMVGLAEILDMYYEDVYTLPDKQLSSGVVADYTNLAKNQRGTSFLKMLSFALAGGVFVILVNIVSRLYWPNLRKSQMSPTMSSSISLSETSYYQHQSLEAAKVEELCISVVKKIKDSVGWPGDIVTDKVVGAWSGELPIYLERLYNVGIGQETVSCNEKDTKELLIAETPVVSCNVEGSKEPITEVPLDVSTSVASVSGKSNNNLETKSVQNIFSSKVVSSSGEDTEEQPITEAPVDLSTSASSLSNKSNNDLEAKSAENIASYQVVLSKDGDIIGFQPTSRVAVNHWASNPLAKELYKGKKISPGLIEPGLKISLPRELVQLELLMSVNSESWFVLARPIQ